MSGNESDVVLVWKKIARVEKPYMNRFKEIQG